MANSVEYQNPIVPGFSPDPSIIHVDSVFYLVNSTFHIYPGLPIYTSKDLKQWTQIGNAINRLEQLSLQNTAASTFPLDTGEKMVATGGLFAPTIRYHKGVFYIICTNAVMEPPYDMQNFIVTTTDIWSGNWSDPINTDFNGIDPSLFFDDDDRVYFQGCFFLDRSKQPSCTIKQYEIDVKTGKHLSEEREIWGGHARYDTEGPHIYKIGKWYYLLVAEGGTFEHHMLCIARSENIWGPYEDFENNPILTADGKDEYIQNIGHGELFQDGQGYWWAAVLGVRNEDGIWGLGRETFLASVDWPEGGWPAISQPKMKFTSRSALAYHDHESNASKASASLDSLADMDYVYIRDADSSKYKLPPPNGSQFAISPSFNTLSTPKGTCSFLGKRQRSLAAITTAAIDLTKEMKGTTGIKAGLSVYKDNLRHASLVYDFDARKTSLRTINLITGLDEISAIDFPVNDEEQELQLKIVASAKEYNFFARSGSPAGQYLDGSSSTETWFELGKLDCRTFSAREMTGPIFGIFAHTTSQEEEAIEVVFSDFKISDS